MPTTISFMGATAKGPWVRIQLVNNSAQYALAGSKGVSVRGAFPLDSLLITQDTIQFGLSPRATFTGTVSLNLVPNPPNGAPVILISNLNFDSATVTYPTQNGPETQVLTPGRELTLSGFVAD